MTNRADGIIDLYERHAATFDGLRGKTLMEAPWLDRFLAPAMSLQRAMPSPASSPRDP